MGRKTKYSYITSPELLAEVNKKNTELLNDFLDYLRSVGRSHGTISQYKNDIEICFVWCLKFNDNKFFVDWTKRQIIKLQNWLLNNNGNSPARVRRLKASLSSLSNFIENLLDDEYPDFRNIINKVESPVNQPVRDKTVITEEQANSLLDYLVENGKYDKACSVALAMYSGRRKSELLRFKVSDFGEDHLVCDGALYQSDPIKTKGRGVGGKMLKTYCLAKYFKPFLDKWMQFREEHGIESEWLFPDENDPSKHAQVSLLNSWTNGFSKFLGFPFYYHACRHFTTTYFKRAGIPDSVIQQYIGWASISMVSVYNDLEADEQLSMYFGKEGITETKPASLSDL